MPDVWQNNEYRTPKEGEPDAETDARIDMHQTLRDSQGKLISVPKMRELLHENAVRLICCVGGLTKLVWYVSHMIKLLDVVHVHVKTLVCKDDWVHIHVSSQGTNSAA